MNKLIIIIVIIALASAGTFFYLENKKLETISTASSKNIEDAFLDITNILANPDDCLTNLQGKSAIAATFLNKIQKNGKEVYPSESTKSEILSISSMEMKNLPSDVKANKAVLQISLREKDKQMFRRAIHLYVEVDSEDKITYCHALSSSLSGTSRKNLTKAKLRILHSKARGIEAKAGGVKTSIAAAACPEGYLMTGCTGSVEGCEANGEVLRKVEPQALNPNVCEVRADASAVCPAFANATAICAKVIDE